MMYSWENDFGKRTAWSLLYFLNYAYYDQYLAQPQILVTNLYFFFQEIIGALYFLYIALCKISF